MPGWDEYCADCHEYGPPCKLCKGKGYVGEEVPYREYSGSAIQVDYVQVDCPLCQG